MSLIFKMSVLCFHWLCSLLENVILHVHSATFSTNSILFIWAKYSSLLRYVEVLKQNCSVMVLFKLSNHGKNLSVPMWKC